MKKLICLLLKHKYEIKCIHAMEYQRICKRCGKKQTTYSYLTGGHYNWHDLT